MAGKLKIAVVGSGPSGCYLAQSLRKLLPESELTVIDRLPVPYGLVRYGVAGDHQGTKAVTKQFARLFERDGVTFLGNVNMGSDIHLTELQQIFDITVLATGLSADRSLGAAFDAVDTVYGAGRITRLWNGHPDEAGFTPALGQTVLVVGNGNVAMDLVRLLAKGAEDLDGSDLRAQALGHGVRHIHLVGRSSADKAKFDAAMVRELGKIAGLTVEMPALPTDEANTVLRELAALAGKSGDGRKTLTFHFETSPISPVMTEGGLAGLTCGSANGETTLPCDSVISAIGFDASDPMARDTLLEDALSPEAGHLSDRLYATGWFRRGPRGTIADNRADAKAIAKTIADSTETWTDAPRPGLDALFQKVGAKATCYADWQAIDAAEQNAAPPNRVRAKIITKAEMLSLCRAKDLQS